MFAKQARQRDAAVAKKSNSATATATAATATAAADKISVAAAGGARLAERSALDGIADRRDRGFARGKVLLVTHSRGAGTQTSITLVVALINIIFFSRAFAPQRIR